MSAKLLVADDEAFIREAYKDGLTAAGFVVSIAADGNQALDMIQSDPPDVILLDLIMPGKTGFEILKIVKSDPRLQAIPVVILSNLSQASDESEARNLGAIDFLVKSDYSLKELVVKISKVVGTEGTVPPPES